jgi:hypothetical protein
MVPICGECGVAEFKALTALTWSSTGFSWGA